MSPKTETPPGESFRTDVEGLRAVAIVADIPSCVSENLHDFRACAFRKHDRRNRDFDVRATQETRGHLISLTHEICRHVLCRAVIGNVLVYRDDQHLTATYARTLRPWIEPELKRVVQRH